MEIEFQGQYTKEEYLRAIRIIGKPSKWGMALRILFLLLSVGLVIYYAVTTIQGGGFTGSETSRLVRYLITMSILGYLVAKPYLDIRATAAKLWNDPLVQRPVSGRVDSLGVTYENYTQNWDGFAYKFLTDDLVILMTTDRTMSLLPRHFFRAESDWRMFRQLVDQRVIVAK